MLQSSYNQRDVKYIQLINYDLFIKSTNNLFSQLLADENRFSKYYSILEDWVELLISNSQFYRNLTYDKIIKLWNARKRNKKKKPKTNNLNGRLSERFSTQKADVQMHYSQSNLETNGLYASLLGDRYRPSDSENQRASYPKKL